LPNVPVHAIQRGNNRQAIFFDEADYRFYLDCLKKAAEKYDCLIHAYVLMTNHVHLLITPEHRESLSRFFQYVGRFYVAYINKTYDRTGTLWEGRFKASLIEEDQYLLSCYRYIELNPVRARMVKRPEDYPWSSYQYNGLQKHDDLLTPHALYLQLGRTEAERRQAYRALFKTALSPGVVEEMRGCLQSGTPLGDERFRCQIEQTLNVNVGQAKRGRPRKVKCKKN